MLAKICGSGLANMYMVTDVDAKLAAVTAKTLENMSLSVFQGAFSCCSMHNGPVTCDKQELMEPVRTIPSTVRRGPFRMPDPLPKLKARGWYHRFSVFTPKS